MRNKVNFEVKNTIPDTSLTRFTVSRGITCFETRTRRSVYELNSTNLRGNKPLIRAFSRFRLLIYKSLFVQYLKEAIKIANL